MGLGARLPAQLRQHKPGRATLLLIVILAAGAALRLYGLNWDGGHWLHPDERRIYFVVEELGWPNSLAQALGPDSPLNPRFFAYGSLPLYLLKAFATLLGAVWPAAGAPGNLHLAGRLLAILFDLGSIYLTYRLARELWPHLHPATPPARPPEQREPLPALLAAALVSLAVLSVQIGHFYTVDPLLTFFVMLTLNLAIDTAWKDGRHAWIGLGVGLGLALATKLTIAPLALVVPVACVLRRARLGGNWARVTRDSAAALSLAGLLFFALQPYVLLDWPTFVEHTLREAQIARGALEAPYVLQYEGTLPFLYSMWQMALWGLALPLGLAAWAGLAALLVRWLRHGRPVDALWLTWAGLYFLFVGLLHTRYLRYMLPLLPILCLAAVDLAAGLRRRGQVLAYGLLGGASLVYVLLFVRIYAAPHSWIAASSWIYRQVPAGSSLAVEHWDLPLPLDLEVDDRLRTAQEYEQRTLALYDLPDDAAKWQALAADLAASDYVVIASRRLYGSIPRRPDRYPLSSRYYDLLFAGELGFALTAEFERGPAWLNPRLPPLPGAAPALLRPDESFVVYDHPRALILRNVERLPAGELLRRLGVSP